MNQLVLGASIPFALAMALYLLLKRCPGLWWYLLTPLLMALGAIYAVVPDIPRLIGNRALYDRLARDPRMDIFLWHHTIDQSESDSPWWGAVFLLMAACMLWAAWSRLRQSECVKK